MDNNSSDELKIRRIAGGSVVDHPTLFSSDGEILFVIWNNIVRTYSSTTGEWLRDLEDLQHKIIELQFDLFNPKILIGCSAAGEVCAWKWKSGIVHKKINLIFPVNYKQVLNFHLVDLSGDHSDAIIIWKEPKSIYAYLDYFDLNANKIITPNGVKKLELSVEHPAKIAVDSKHRYIALIQYKALYAISLDEGRFKTIQKNLATSKNFPFTDVKCHPVEQSIITGRENGMIQFWRNIFGFYAMTLYHWHSTPVQSISFSETGSIFYSGGREKVLVKWTLDKSELIQFLPRLPGEIRHISVALGNHQIAVSMQDNGIRIYNSNFKMISVIQHFTWMPNDNTKRDPFPIGLKMNPRTNGIVLNGREGSLQFFSPYTRSLLYNVDVIDENLLIVESGKTLFNSRVVKAALSMNWLVTAEVRNDLKFSPHNRLKFWKFSNEKQNYQLNTNIELPHFGNITGLEFSSQTSDENLLCASTGYDNYIKLWAPRDTDSIYRKGLVWYCIARTQYKNLPIKAIAFSQDGSLLSAGCGNSLCIWNAENLKLKCVLSSPIGMDGGVNKLLISLPDKISPGNGVRSTSKPDRRQIDALEKRKLYLEQIKLLLENSQYITQFLKFVKLNTSDAVKQPSTSIKRWQLNLREKELIFKRVMGLNDLNLVQKFQIFSYLKICCRTRSDLKSKLLDTLKDKSRKNEITENTINNLIYNLNYKVKYHQKFKLSNLTERKSKYYQKFKQNAIGFDKLIYDKTLNGGSVSNGKLCDSSKSDEENDDSEADVKFPIKIISQINHVLFGTGDFAHLVIVCTGNRMLVWNLLTLRLQTAVKLSVKNITLDPYTNLVAAFTENNELYVFLPNVPMPLYHRKNMPSVYGGIWIPRRISKQTSLNLDWQSVSQLYFLSEDQELLYLISDKDVDGIAPSVALSSENTQSMAMTPFGAILSKHISTGNQLANSNRTFSTIGLLGTSAVKEITTLSPHTMCPVNQLCKNFLKSLLINELKNDQKQQSAKENVALVLENGRGAADSDMDDDAVNDNGNLKSKIADRKNLLKKYEELQSKPHTNIEIVKIEMKLKKIVKQKLKFKF